jgi:translation initiation factor 3 subunit A
VHAERRALVARRRELLSELAVCKKKEDAVRRAEATRRAKDEADKREWEERAITRGISG